MTAVLTRESLTSHVGIEFLDLERSRFVGQLVDTGLIRQEFVDTGALDLFQIDEKSGIDSLKHILVGDSTGGLHHLRTVAELGMTDRVVASQIQDPNRPDRPRKKFRQTQRVKENGSFQAGIVDIIQDGITYSKERFIEGGGKTTLVKDGSSMFPAEWTTQQVLEAIILATSSEARVDNDRKTFEYESVISDVRVRAVVSQTSGKIVTAMPMVGK